MIFLNLLFIFSISNASEKTLLDIPSKTLLKAPQLNISELKNHIVVVDFWASWCEPCKESIPYYENTLSKLKNVKVILINEDSSPKDGEDFLKESKVQIQSQYDSESQLAKKWEIEALPTVVVFDKNSKIVKTFRGFTKSKKIELENLIEKLF